MGKYTQTVFVCDDCSFESTEEGTLSSLLSQTPWDLVNSEYLGEDMSNRQKWLLCPDCKESYDYPSYEERKEAKQ